MYKKVLITGAGGQLGMDLVRLYKSADYDVMGLTKLELDITEQECVIDQIVNFHPDLIVHAAAYTAVDNAETNIDLAFKVNAIGTRNIAIGAKKVNAKLIYISTDYVFNGLAKKKLNEFNSVEPIGVYGRSKLAGENFVRELCNDFFIVRTSWVYGFHGENFVKTMLKLGEEKKELRVVDDQIGSPTFSEDLALKIIEIGKTDKYGIYHVSNNGSCSWFEFANEIFRIKGINVNLIPVSTEEFQRPAKRPAYSVLDHMSLRINGFNPMPDWKTSLERFLDYYKSI